MSLLASVTQPNLCNFYFALANDPSLNNANWSEFPAVSTIDASGNAIINTSSVEIDGQFLTADATDLLLNGVPIATINNLSDIADWSIYPSLSGGVDMATYRIKNASNISFVGGNTLVATGGKALVNGLDVVRLWSQCNALTDVNAGGHSIVNVGTGLGTIQTGSSNNILVNGVDVATAWSEHPAICNVNMNSNAITNATEVQCDTLELDNKNITATASDLYVNGNPVGSEWSTLPAISDVNVADNSIVNVSSLALIYGPSASAVLTASGGFLYVNGNKVAEGGDVDTWSTHPAISDVAMNGHSISGAVSITSTNAIGSNGITSTGATNLYGDVYFHGFVGGGSSFQFVRSSTPSVITATSDIHFNGNSNVFNGNCNILGSSSYAASNYLYGGTTIDGGLVRGCSIGCLPEPVFPYFNTQRIDVLPAGINVITPTYVTIDGLGAFNVAMGGAVALAAGSYMTLEHGFGLGSNGIYVQDTARDDAARLVFEFGGSVGNSIDTPARAGQMAYYGTDMFIANIGPNTSRYPQLPYLNITGVSSETFYGGASIISGPSGALTISGEVNIPSLTLSGFNIAGPLNMNGYNICNAGTIFATTLISTTVATSNTVCRTFIPDPIYADSGFLFLGEIQVLANASHGGSAISVDLIECSTTGGHNSVTLSGYLSFASSISAGQNINYPSYIAQGTGGYALQFGGSAEIFGNLDMTNHSLLNVAGATLNSLTMTGNLNMNSHSIDNCVAIATTNVDLTGGASIVGTGSSNINVNAAAVTFNSNVAVGGTLVGVNLTMPGTSTLGTIAVNGGASIVGTGSSNINVNAAAVTFNSNVAVAGNLVGVNLSIPGLSTLGTIGGSPTMSVPLNFNGQTGTNVPNPAGASNVANKQYVDSAATAIIPAFQVISNATPTITIATMPRTTFIFTAGVVTANFVSAGMVAGNFAYVKNATLSNIAIQLDGVAIPGIQSTLYPQVVGSTNAPSVLLYYNGTTLTMY